MAALEHEMRAECAAQFAELKAARDLADENRRDVRQDVKDLHIKIDAGFAQGLDAIATLKERSRNWGLIGGALSSLVITIVGGVLVAVVLM